MSLRTRLLTMADRVRGIPGKLDLRQNVVTVVVRTWTANESGEGAYVDSESVLTVDTAGTPRNVRVREVSSRDIVASGGYLTAQDLKVGPFTPQNLTVGVDGDTYDPLVEATGREVFFRVTGQGMPEGGRWYKRTSDDNLGNFTSMLYLRATGEHL